MKSRWSAQTAQDYIARYAEQNICADLALRVYTSQLLGADPALVLHGGGNTSVKLTQTDMLGDQVDTLCVKGSGWDMATIEPAGLPAVRLEPLRRLRARDTLTDEEMVAFQRSNLLDPASPNPSVEALLHAFIDQKFIDHTHSTAVLSICNQAEAVSICQEIYGARMGIVPYIMPGFQLAKKCADIYEQDPSVEGLILLHHGIFTFGESAEQAYERMIEMVTRAEDYISQRPAKSYPARHFADEDIAPLEKVLPVLRGNCAIREGDAPQRLFTDVRSSPEILAFVNGQDLAEYGRRGVITPDHIIRLKNKPLVTDVPYVDKLDEFALSVQQNMRAFQAEYQAYFDQNAPRYQAQPKKRLDCSPRYALIPGIGLVGMDKTRKGAAIAADIAEGAISSIINADRVADFKALGDDDLFDMEYWSLEQAKLGKSKPLPLQGQVVVVTGAAGAIGAATAKLFASNGAEVALLDLDQAAVDEVAKQIGGFCLALACDVTDPIQISTAYQKICTHFGGVDVLISNAGAAWQGAIGDLSDAVLRKSFELNFFSHQYMAQQAVAIMEQQQTGGCLLFNASKQAINPGQNFGAYGLPKAATLFLSRQYALEYGRFGIRANAVNADRIRSGLLSDDMISKRSKARGLSEGDYMAGNLLQQEVLAEDVAEAFLHQALAQRTTAHVTTVDGGNIAAILR